jgi:hypothetical protein
MDTQQRQKEPCNRLQVFYKKPGAATPCHPAILPPQTNICSGVCRKNRLRLKSRAHLDELIVTIEQLIFMFRQK